MVHTCWVIIADMYNGSFLWIKENGPGFSEVSVHLTVEASGAVLNRSWR